ncbi:MAG: DUF2149 domain-containing protein [Coriobacteriales bacterium]|jgi:hypothetical protein
MKHRDVMADPFGSNEESSDDFSPTEGLSNLADCMLVLACGLMVALVVNFNLDVGPTYAEVKDTENMVTVDQDVERVFNGETDSTSESESTYEEMGTLFRDTKTGKMYYLKDSSSASADANKKGSD